MVVKKFGSQRVPCGHVPANGYAIVCVLQSSVANFRFVSSSHTAIWFSFALGLGVYKLLGCYMVKPHGQLVQVSSTPHSAYTPCLSTS